MYEEMLGYDENSMLFNLDSNNVYSANLSYSFTSAAKDEEIIKEYYLGLLSRDDNIKKILEHSGTDYSLNDIEDLILISSPEEINAKSEGTNISISNNKNYGFGTIRIIIVGENEEFVRNVKETIEKIINEDDGQLRNRYADYSLTKVTDSIVLGNNPEIIDKKMARIDDRQKVYDSLTDIEGKLNSNEKLYYSYYYDYDNVFANAKSHFSIKWPIVFGAVFALMMCFFYFAVYLFDGKVKNEDELRSRFSMPLLGIMKQDETEYKGIDKILNNFDKCEYVDYAYLGDLLKHLNKKILICNEEEKIADDLKKMDKKIKVCGYLDKDSKALDSLKERDGIVIIIKNGHTEINRIERQLELTKKLNKEVIGFISIR